MSTLMKDASVVCPQCYRGLREAIVDRQSEDRYGRMIRHYLGRCAECELKVEVMQFHREDSWHLHCYRAAAIAAAGLGEWVTVEPLPGPAAPLLLGPGGDYEHLLTPEMTEHQMVAASQRAADLLSQAAALIEMMRRYLRRRRTE